MTEIAFKSQMTFDPAPESQAADAVANGVYSTPAALQESLGDLARLKYLRASLAGVVELSVSDTATLVVHLTDGGTLDKTVEVAIAAGTRGEFEIPDVDLSSLSGQTAVSIVVDVTVAGTAGTTFKTWAKLNVEFPLIISGC